jgi:hypothetical protein
VPRNPHTMPIAVSANPVKAGGATFGCLEEVRRGAGFHPY